MTLQQKDDGAIKGICSPFAHLGIGRSLMAGAAALLTTFAPHVEAAPRFSDCGGNLMQQDNGAWVYFGQASGSNSGMAGYTTSSYLQGLSNAATVNTRRLKSLDTLFASPTDPGRKALRIYCNIDHGTGHAALSDGTLVGWGTNSSGQIGNGDTASKSVATGVVAVTNVISMAGGSNFTLALKSDGTVYAWGANNYGQVADATMVASRPIPAQIYSLSGVTAVAAGSAHAVALLSDGTLRSWGYNANGELGNGLTANSSSPVTVLGLTNVVAISAGYHYTLALKSDGTVWAWGDNYYGQLGNGSGADQPTPVRVGTLPTNITSITANFDSTSFALGSDGRVWGWGYNSSNYSLLQRSCGSSCLPAVITGLPSAVSQVYANEAFAMARTTDGKLYGWGSNYYSDLALGFVNYSSSPNYFSTPMLAHQGVTPSDFDQDYVSDILFRNTSTGDVWLWDMQNSAIASSAGVGNVSNDWKIVGLGDADGDGKKDIFWRNSVTGENAIWLMDNRQFKGSVPLDTISDQNWKIVAIADLDGDGRADIIWRNESAGQFSLWLVGANGVTQTRAYTGVPSNWEIRGAADFNGDGKADIVWRDKNTGAIALYRMDGVIYSGIDFLAGGLADWDIAAIGDVDRDGYADILFRHYTGGVLAVVKLVVANVGGATSIGSSSTKYMYAAGGDWQVSALGDFDGDSYTDILWRNAAGELVIWSSVSGLAVAPGANVLPPVASNVHDLGNPGTVWQVVAK